MAVQILFFGATADITGQRRLDVKLDGNLTTGDIFEQLISQFPQLAKQRLLISLNQEYVGRKETLKDGDELAIFTAVSGG